MIKSRSILTRTKISRAGTNGRLGGRVIGRDLGVGCSLCCRGEMRLACQIARLSPEPDKKFIYGGKVWKKVFSSEWKTVPDTNY